MPPGGRAVRQVAHLAGVAATFRIPIGSPSMTSSRRERTSFGVSRGVDGGVGRFPTRGEIHVKDQTTELQHRITGNGPIEAVPIDVRPGYDPSLVASLSRQGPCTRRPPLEPSRTCPALLQPRSGDGFEDS